MGHSTLPVHAFLQGSIALHTEESWHKGREKAGKSHSIHNPLYSNETRLVTYASWGDQEDK